MKEIWKEIPNTKKYYFASNIGRVKSVRFGRELIMKQPIRNGYKYVNLNIDGDSKKVNVHRIIAKLFVENKKNKPQVNHKDLNRLNNFYTNLEWVTAKENIRHARDHGRMGMSEKSRIKLSQRMTGEKHPCAKFKRDDIVIIKDLIETNSYNQRELADIFGVHKATISKIARGVIWGHV